MKIYNAGHMLTRGAQFQRQVEKDELNSVASDLEWYDPKENKEINDKANLDNNDGLAEKIVRQDTNALFWADTVVIEPLPEALGTHVELGQLKGMRDMATAIVHIINNATSVDDAFMRIGALCDKQINRAVYPHYEDIRRFKGANESEDRRSWGINQYVYGVCLDLTEGKGLYDWSEVLKELSNEE